MTGSGVEVAQFAFPQHFTIATVRGELRRAADLGDLSGDAGGVFARTTFKDGEFQTGRPRVQGQYDLTHGWMPLLEW